ncbi:MAG: iron-containing alcohol dehydrogenase [Proteobacteria bacterium]|nr:iron-containing alcohol dehydrogenase [Pseudomonadota bacterium]MBU1581418.1 iron-containing alcohol dehydrogenase [Pseudomonadota bacterium]MBU2454870.1 iron-containing alcohol dehydrogenase [Pseudomonadota bacterium]MBU2631785.1 iron-containing alcohol dehydrogenase [Pseudomonadota bacterium]
MLPDYFEFSLPTKLVYGVGILDSIEDAVARFGKKKALLVTDQILLKAGPVDRVKKGFKKTNIKIAAIFDAVPPNSTIKTVQDCAALGRKKKCDMIIAVGGGSVIDTAKVANLLMTKGGNVQDHMGAYLLDPSDTLLPAIVIPTTAGTGSEVTKVAVIADPDNDVKLPFAEEQFLPQLAILDPEMTVSMPPRLTAYTGMDALVHAIEAYVDKEWSPASDALALHAIKLITDNILQACDKPEDLQARGAMQVGSFLAGVAFSHSMVGMVHGISHALGGVYHIPHGLANTLILPEVMEYNLESKMERYADVALAMGISFPTIISDSQSVIKSGALDLITRTVKKTDLNALKSLVDDKAHKIRDFAVKKLENLGFVDGWIRRQAAIAGIEKVRILNRQLSYLTQMPLNLKDAGIKDDLAKLDQVADTAMEDGSMLYNPVEPEREAVIEIIEKVYYSTEKPLAVSEEDLRPKAQKKATAKKMSNVFKDTDMLYDILMDFYETLKNDPGIGPSLLKTHLCIQFKYKKPNGIITIDATGDETRVIKGDFAGTPEVIMSMDADFAHRFWHGKVNLVTALTRRQVVAKGNVPKTLKLLPILKPAYDLYPLFLRNKGLEELIIK